LGWAPQVTFEEGLRRTVEYLAGKQPQVAGFNEFLASVGDCLGRQHR
jgi:dTDP-D-glucose 4,6-dehydratase